MSHHNLKGINILKRRATSESNSHYLVGHIMVSQSLIFGDDDAFMKKRGGGAHRVRKKNIQKLHTRQIR